jgi:hypothetical protein
VAEPAVSPRLMTAGFGMATAAARRPRCCRLCRSAPSSVRWTLPRLSSPDSRRSSPRMLRPRHTCFTSGLWPPRGGRVRRRTNTMPTGAASRGAEQQASHTLPSARLSELADGSPAQALIARSAGADLLVRRPARPPTCSSSAALSGQADRERGTARDGTGDAGVPARRGCPLVLVFNMSSVLKARLRGATSRLRPSARLSV